MYRARGEGNEKSTRLNLSRSARLLEQSSGLTANSPLGDLSLIESRPRGSLPKYAMSDITLGSPTIRRSAALNRTMDADDTIALLVERRSSEAGLNTTNVEQLVREEGSQFEGPEIFEKFCNIYMTNKDSGDVFGMVDLLIATLTEQTNISKALLHTSSISRRKLQMLRMHHMQLRSEMWTWQLVESLFRDHLKAEMHQEGDMDTSKTDNSNSQMSDYQLMEQLYTNNGKVRRCQIVIDWLETVNRTDQLETFSQKVDYFVEKTCCMWENTLHALKNHPNSNQTRMLISELDPDAPVRTGGKLSTLDVEDDDRLLKYVFALIRAGKLDEAQQLCVRCGQAWRAATLEGWRLYHDPNFEQFDDGRLQAVNGNAFRDIWKSACWTMSKDDHYSAYERAIYGVLTGNLDSVLSVCDTWSDHLWAYLKVLVDVELEHHIRLHRSSSNDIQIVELPAEYWARDYNLTQMFKELDANCKVQILDEGENFFHQIQKFLILNNIKAVVELMLDTVVVQHTSPHVLRFMTHLVLFLRMIDHIAVQEAVVTIVEKYINYLIYSQQHELVAQYCSVLPQEAQPLIYAPYLQAYVKDDSLRRKVLEFAERAGMDVQAITTLVVRNSTLKLIDQFDMSREVNQTLSAENNIKVDDIISSLDWVLFYPEQLMEALRQANAQMRIYIVIQQSDKMKKVFNKLPADCVNKLFTQNPDLRTPTDDSNAADYNAVKEFLCFKAFMDASTAFEDWFKYSHQKPAKPESPKSKHFADSVSYEPIFKQYQMEMKKWTNSSTALTQYTVEMFKKVLMFAGGWMTDFVSSPEANDTDGQRQSQLKNVRSLCIPQITHLLHKVLHETEQYKECLQIADIIASEDYKLYATFSKTDLRSFLQRVQSSSNKMLDTGSDSLGYTSAS